MPAFPKNINTDFSLNLCDLLAGEPTKLAAWLEGPKRRLILTSLFLIVVCSGIYGISIGLWRGPLQSIYTAIKFPLFILLTCVGNAFLNGLLAQLLGVPIGFVKSTLMILLSFAIMSLILVAFTPIMLFLLWNTPALGLEDTSSRLSHSITLLAHVFLIAFAGIVSNQRLYFLLRYFCGHGRTALVLLFSWLAGNLLLGSQMSWILRPFIGSPNLPVQFLRSDPFDGNFFESVWRSLQLLFS
ncbi:MAG: hypothetical protein ACK5LK_04610 [Chthoniobacterales bacterium]